MRIILLKSVLLDRAWLFLFKFHLEFLLIFCLEAIGSFHLSMNSVKNLAKIGQRCEERKDFCTALYLVVHTVLG